MVQTVKIRKADSKIKINFTYNDELVDIMRGHHGYFFKKEKAWIFPANKQSELYNVLTDKHYNVEFVKPKEQKTVMLRKKAILNPWDDKDAVSVAGHCTKCGMYGFCNREGLCIRCRLNSNKEEHK